MRRFALFIVCFTAIVLFGVSLPHSHRHVQAAQAQAGNCTTATATTTAALGEAHVCQMRRTTFALSSGHLNVETINGGIDVTGEDRSDVALEARVTAWAPSDSEANDVLRQVVIDAANVSSVITVRILTSSAAAVTASTTTCACRSTSPLTCTP